MTKLKYVMFEVRQGDVVRKVPVLFTDALTHVDVMRQILPALGQHGKTAQVVSAGVAYAEDLACEGDSESLGMSTHIDDTRIMKTYDALHGVVAEASSL